MNLLLIMPAFFEYPDAIIGELRRMGYAVDFFDDRPSTNGIVKAVIRIKKELIHGYIKQYFDRMMRTVTRKQYDKVLVISGQSLCFTKQMMEQLRASQTQAEFILYQWDSLRNFPYIKELYEYFDRCFSFDWEDVRENTRLEFLPLFYTSRYERIGAMKEVQYKYDFSFVGTAHPKKYRFISNMESQLKRVYKDLFIYYYFPSRIVYFYRKIRDPEFKKARYREFHFKAIRGEKMDAIIRDSKCVLDSPQDGQNGLTIRVFEALGARRKLITTNENVKHYDFYRESNIYVYKGSFDYRSPFFTEPYEDLPQDLYCKYALRCWLSRLLEKTVEEKIITEGDRDATSKIVVGC